MVSSCTADSASDVDPACIRLLGSGDDLLVENYRSEHVRLPLRIKAAGDGDTIDHVVIRDNVIRYTDPGAASLADGGAWGTAFPSGRLYDTYVLRNSLFQIGRRPNRFGQGHAIDIDCAETVETAGNMGYRLPYAPVCRGIPAAMLVCHPQVRVKCVCRRRASGIKNACRFLLRGLESAQE